MSLLSEIASRVRSRRAASTNGAQSYFGEPDRYLKGTDLRTRSRIIRELVGELEGARILDVGCGDGTLSAQFLERGNRVTFVDFSEAMLERARAMVGTRSDATFRQGDLMSLSTGGDDDVVLCIGVLAHVPDVRSAVGRLAAIARPGGRVVLQYTDLEKGSALPLRIWSSLREALAPEYRYRLQPTTGTLVTQSAREAGLVLLDERRYWLAPPISRLVLSKEARHQFEELTLRSRVLSALGHEVISIYRRAAD